MFELDRSVDILRIVTVYIERLVSEIDSPRYEVIIDGIVEQICDIRCIDVSEAAETAREERRVVIRSEDLKTQID